MTINRAIDVKAIEAEENLLVDAHFLIEELMRKKSISQTELAKRMGCSKARLSQLLNPSANPTVKSLGRLFYALGEEVTFAQVKPHSSFGGGNGWKIDANAASADKLFTIDQLHIFGSLKKRSDEPLLNDNECYDDFILAEAV